MLKRQVFYKIYNEGNMFKKLSISIIVLMIFVSLTNFSQAQKTTNRFENAISVDPVDLLIGKTLSVTYEHQVAKINTITGSVLYARYDEHWSAFGIGACYRWYPLFLDDGKKPIEGLSVGPMARLLFFNFSNGPVSENDTYIVIGGDAAYKWIFDKWVVEPVFHLGIGLTSITGLGYNGWGLGVNLGYAW